VIIDEIDFMKPKVMAVGILLMMRNYYGDWFALLSRRNRRFEVIFWHWIYPMRRAGGNGVIKSCIDIGCIVWEEPEWTALRSQTLRWDSNGLVEELMPDLTALWGYEMSMSSVKIEPEWAT
jgi:hypothetical protein